MNIEMIKSGDIIEFRIANDVYHGLVTSKGHKFIKSFHNPDNLLYITVLEHPEWKDFVVTADKVIKVFVVAEVVNFS